MNKALAILGSAALAMGVSACSFVVRDAATYATDTQALLATRGGPIKACYDEALKTDSQVGGNVAVRFTVEKKTGNVLEPTLVPERTTAPPALSDCVLNQLSGLVLDPPDRRMGDATFVWEFKANAPMQAPAAEPAPAAPPAS
jgi:hypothetical protein